MGNDGSQVRQDYHRATTRPTAYSLQTVRSLAMQKCAASSVRYPKYNRCLEGAEIACLAEQIYDLINGQLIRGKCLKAMMIQYSISGWIVGPNIESSPQSEI